MSEHPSQTTDLAIVGSSLLGTMYGLLQKPSETVVVLEREHTVGGCWRNEAGLGLPSMENGTHMFFHDHEDKRPLYDLMARVFEVEFEPMTPYPHVFFRKSLPVYPLEAPENALVRAIDKTWREISSGKRVFPNIERLFRLAFRHGPQLRRFFSTEAGRQLSYQYQYIKGGTLELMQKVERIVDAQPNMWFERKFEVQAIEKLEDGTFALSDDAGRCLSARRVLLTAGSRIGAVVDCASGARITMPYEERIINHINFLIADPEPARPFSFVQFEGFKHLRWLTEITPYCAAVPAGRRVLCVRLHTIIDDAQLPQVAAEVFKQLQVTGHLSPRAIVEDRTLLAYNTCIRTEDELREISAALPCGVEMVYSRYYLESIQRLMKQDADFAERVRRVGLVQEAPSAE